MFWHPFWTPDAIWVRASRECADCCREKLEGKHRRHNIKQAWYFQWQLFMFWGCGPARIASTKDAFEVVSRKMLQFYDVPSWTRRVPTTLVSKQPLRVLPSTCKVQTRLWPHVRMPKQKSESAATIHSGTTAVVSSLASGPVRPGLRTLLLQHTYSAHDHVQSAVQALHLVQQQVQLRVRALRLSGGGQRGGGRFWFCEKVPYPTTFFS